MELVSFLNFIHIPTCKITVFVIVSDSPKIKDNILFWENKFCWEISACSYSLSAPCENRNLMINFSIYFNPITIIWLKRAIGLLVALNLFLSTFCNVFLLLLVTFYVFYNRNYSLQPSSPLSYQMQTIKLT